MKTTTERVVIRGGGYNPITPLSVEYQQVTITSSSAGVSVAHTSGDANNNQGLLVPVDGQLTMLLAPGTQLFVGGPEGSHVGVSTTDIPIMTALNHVESMAKTSRVAAKAQVIIAKRMLSRKSKKPRVILRKVA